MDLIYIYIYIYNIFKLVSKFFGVWMLLGIYIYIFKLVLKIGPHHPNIIFFFLLQGLHQTRASMLEEVGDSGFY